MIAPVAPIPAPTIAESDVGTVITGGFGVNLLALRIDAAGAVATRKTTFDGNEIPREVRGSLALAIDF